MHKDNSPELPTVALVWAQFAAYHVDRCEAVARRLKGKANVLALEVATTSLHYAWEPSGDVAGAQKVTLFPGQSYNAVPLHRRFMATFRALRRCDWVMIGLSYAEPLMIVLAWTLRLCGVKVVVFSESKEDDKPRRRFVEMGKRIVLGAYCGAIVGATRHIAYFRQLGFRRRPVLPGYDTVSVNRLREQAGGVHAPDGAPFDQRPFVFVGRFVGKKNLLNMIEAFALYAKEEGSRARKLILAGSGEDEEQMRALIERHEIANLVTFTGFLTAPQVSRLLPDALCLVLVSREEQWGLVVNEALALGLPAIVSHQVGSRDALVRHGRNGAVVNSEDPAEIAAAMRWLGQDEQVWREQVAHSHARAWMGDTERLADAVAAMTGLVDDEPAVAAARFARAIGED
ncbi:glycosyltransferase [Novosphingobium sp. TH158]|uniref:glycosyltransferase n=1 Tax=Novosphingobium sp. TH158 TaxID=2067455 RepID=UPI000C7CFE57|nr:glycosyltransferase [Novosphingobium sp. TH158]PLK27033.1 glycosyl transferase family 1 [Novosphingobium sp. TH158]